MAGVNKVILVGRLGGDVEMNTTNNGAAVANFTMATSENWKDKDGQKQEKTEWHKIVVFAKLAEICGEYLHKGKQVYIEGRIQTRKWEDKDGNDRYTTEIVANQMQMLGAKGDEAPAPATDAPADGGKNYTDEAPAGDGLEDVPF